MSNIIKPSAPRQPSIENYDRDRIAALDIDQAASELDPKVILAEARAEAEQKVREAYEEGMRRGMEAGQAQFDESVGRAADTLQQASEAMAQARQAFLDSLEPQVVQLAVALAGRILEREVRLDRSVVVTAARAALERVSDEGRVTLRVNPADIEVLREKKPELLGQFEGIATIDLAPDEEVESGGCVAVTESLEIDARLSAQLDLIMAQLLADAADASQDET